MASPGVYFGRGTNAKASCRCCVSAKERDGSPTCAACSGCRYAGVWHRGETCPVRQRQKRVAARGNATRAATRSRRGA